MYADGFDWDDHNSGKCQSHGVSTGEIETMFEGEFALRPDLSHSHEEERFLAIGLKPIGRYMLVAFTFRRRGRALLIRPISARFMHAEEVRRYEEDTSP